MANYFLKTPVPPETNYVNSRHDHTEIEQLDAGVSSFSGECPSTYEYLTDRACTREKQAKCLPLTPLRKACQ